MSTDHCTVCGAPMVAPGAALCAGCNPIDPTRQPRRTPVTQEPKAVPWWAIVAALVVAVAGVFIGGALLAKPAPPQTLLPVGAEGRAAIVIPDPPPEPDPTPALATPAPRSQPRSRSLPPAGGGTRPVARSLLQGAGPCPVCDGAGSVVCAHCDGRLKTQASFDCADCVHGLMRCRACFGQGQRRCAACDGDGEVRKQVGWRRGNGLKTPLFKMVDCADCDGGKARCKPCGGNGSLDCPKCAGSGSISRFEACSECEDGRQACPRCR